MKILLAVAVAVHLAAPGWAATPARLRLPPGARAGERLDRVPEAARWASSSQSGSMAREGAIAGAVVFGVAGALVGHQLCEIAEERQGCQQKGRLAVFTLVSAAVGAGVGALVGSAIK